MKNSKSRFSPQINGRLTVLLLAALPLIFAIVSVAFIVQSQFDNLSTVQLTSVEPILLQARKDEIRDFVETGRKAVAGLIKHARRLDLSGKRVVCVITGSGLKDPDNAMKDAPAIVELPADLAQVASALGLA